MVSNSALAIVISVLFLILVQLVRAVRETSVPSFQSLKQDYNPPGESPTIEYEPFPNDKLAHGISDLLPTLGRWGMNAGMFGILHLITCTYILGVVVLLLAISRDGNNAAVIGVLGMSIIYVLLPFFEVEEYELFSEKKLRPKSIDFHVTGVTIELVTLILGVSLIEFADQNLPDSVDIFSLLTINEFSQNTALILGIVIGYGILHYHNLFLNPTYTVMVSQEVSTIEDGE